MDLIESGPIILRNFRSLEINMRVVTSRYRRRGRCQDDDGPR